MTFGFGVGFGLSCNRFLLYSLILSIWNLSVVLLKGIIISCNDQLQRTGIPTQASVGARTKQRVNPCQQMFTSDKLALSRFLISSRFFES